MAHQPTSDLGSWPLLHQNTARRAKLRGTFQSGEGAFVVKMQLCANLVQSCALLTIKLSVFSLIKGTP